MTLTASSRLLTDAIAAEQGSILVLTGAGISLASGIPTFRGSDEGAVWASDVRELGTYRHFQSNPVGSWQWYRQRFLGALHAKPNAAHFALAAFERWHVARGGRSLLVTQNIDTLHEQAGSLDLAKVHGSADQARCSQARCRWGSTRTIKLSDLDFTAFESEPRRETIPRCSECRSLMRPHVLLFDELYTSHTDYGWSRIVETCATMRLVLAVGTSFSVGVTNLVQTEADRRGVRVFVVDPGASIGAPDSATALRERAEELLPMVVEALMNESRPKGEAP